MRNLVGITLSPQNSEDMGFLEQFEKMPSYNSKASASTQFEDMNICSPLEPSFNKFTPDRTLIFRQMTELRS